PNQLPTPTLTTNTVHNPEFLLQIIQNQHKQINLLMEIPRSNENIQKQPKRFSQPHLTHPQPSTLTLPPYTHRRL
ncbi:hypothetical protein, partial [Staphylococcus epidermidis]|uniref:hypothetical protein n=1 Tax=Staphylococcus epidermidis TaxID=1282 RepID=UPI001C931F3D